MNMENERSPLGELFRKSFDDFQPEPSPAVWEKISSHPKLNIPAKKSSWSTARYVYLSGVTLVVIVGTYFIFQQFRPHEQPRPQNPTSAVQPDAKTVGALPEIISQPKPINPVQQSHNQQENAVQASSKPELEGAKSKNNPSIAMTQQSRENAGNIPGAITQNAKMAGENSSKPAGNPVAQVKNNPSSNNKPVPTASGHSGVIPDNKPIGNVETIENQKICRGEAVTLWASGGTTYEWSTGETTSNITVNPSNTTTYYLTITDHTGQPSESSVLVEVFECKSIYIPNAFNPYSDVNSNSRFRAYGTDISQFTMRIFSRSGQIVYESNDINEGWDGRIKGKPAEMGVYVYQVIYTDVVGKKQTVTGQLTLIK